MPAGRILPGAEAHHAESRFCRTRRGVFVLSRSRSRSSSSRSTFRTCALLERRADDQTRPREVARLHDRGAGFRASALFRGRATSPLSPQGSRRDGDQLAGDGGVRGRARSTRMDTSSVSVVARIQTPQCSWRPRCPPSTPRRIRSASTLTPYIGDDAAAAVAAAAVAGTDLCSIKCAVGEPDERRHRSCRRSEYRMAMLSRHFRPWLTSGALLPRTHRRAARDHGRGTLRGHRARTSETGRTAARPSHAHPPSRHGRATPTRRKAGGHSSGSGGLWWAGAFRHWWINIDRNLPPPAGADQPLPHCDLGDVVREVVDDAEPGAVSPRACPTSTARTSSSR